MSACVKAEMAIMRNEALKAARRRLDALEKKIWEENGTRRDMMRLDYEHLKIRIEMKEKLRLMKCKCDQCRADMVLERLNG